MLQSGGLHIGSQLMGPYEGNPRGHFEDMEFCEFHVAVLTALGLGSEGFVLQSRLLVNEQLAFQARKLIQLRREAGKPWGWKDPRSTLFLDFWREEIPEARFLFLFRAPWEVADSLYRRGDAVIVQNPRLAVEVWQNYNRTVLDFCNGFPERCLLIEGHAAAVAPHLLTEATAAKFGDYFGPIANLFERNLFRYDNTGHQRAVLAQLFPDALELYQELWNRAALVHTLPEEKGHTESSGMDLNWALHHWVECRATEKKVKGVLEEIEHMREEVNRLQAQVAWMEGSRFWRLRQLWLRAKHLLKWPYKQDKP